MISNRSAKSRVLATISCAGNRRAESRCRRGFTLLELLVAIAIIFFLAGIILAAVNLSRSAVNSAQCLQNLHSIAQALSHEVQDHGDYYPDPVALNQSWEQCLQPYLSSTQVFQCPADYEIYPAVGSSYDWRDTGVTNTTLAGRTVNDCNRMTAVLTFESLPGWHGPHVINAALVDGSGSAQSMDQAACLSDLQTPIR